MRNLLECASVDEVERRGKHLGQGLGNREEVLCGCGGGGGASGGVTFNNPPAPTGHFLAVAVVAQVRFFAKCAERVKDMGAGLLVEGRGQVWWGLGGRKGGVGECEGLDWLDRRAGH